MVPQHTSFGIVRSNTLTPSGSWAEGGHNARDEHGDISDLWFRLVGGDEVLWNGHQESVITWGGVVRSLPQCPPMFGCHPGKVGLRTLGSVSVCPPDLALQRLGMGTPPLLWHHGRSHHAPQQSPLRVRYLDVATVLAEVAEHKGTWTNCARTWMRQTSVRTATEVCPGINVKSASAMKSDLKRYWRKHLACHIGSAIESPWRHRPLQCAHVTWRHHGMPPISWPQAYASPCCRLGLSFASKATSQLTKQRHRQLPPMRASRGELLAPPGRLRVQHRAHSHMGGEVAPWSPFPWRVTVPVRHGLCAVGLALSCGRPCIPSEKGVYPQQQWGEWQRPITVLRLWRQHRWRGRR